MTPYAIAWLIAAASALALAALLFLAARRTAARLLLPALALACALVPCCFDGGHAAPAFIVALFGIFFERDADPTGALFSLLAAASAVLASWCVLLGIRSRVRRCPARGKPDRREPQAGSADSADSVERLSA